ncbi:uncharacterized protein LOC133328230 [Musca vetustissima]|uniref:uncharacterized protein LOC133328230 n=1 Tax=Musca vetustissima TaxID=27455 RepID=UPI002AB7789C|nr:uncharacterized protein LOC133328230 [Musca vetustissima]
MRTVEKKNQTCSSTIAKPVTSNSSSSSSITSSTSAIECSTNSSSSSSSLSSPTQNSRPVKNEIKSETKDFNDNYKKEQPKSNQQLQRPSFSSSVAAATVNYISHQEPQQQQQREEQEPTNVNSNDALLGQTAGGQHYIAGIAAAPLDNSVSNLSDDSFSFCFISALLGLH